MPTRIEKTCEQCGVEYVAPRTSRCCSESRKGLVFVAFDLRLTASRSSIRHDADERRPLEGLTLPG